MEGFLLLIIAALATVVFVQIGKIKELIKSVEHITNVVFDLNRSLVVLKKEFELLKKGTPEPVHSAQDASPQEDIESEKPAELHELLTMQLNDTAIVEENESKTVNIDQPEEQNNTESIHTTTDFYSKRVFDTTEKKEKIKSKSREEWEQFIGGKVLNRIGALAIILGVIFFLKYAFDNDLISETIRVLMGGVFGLACIGFAKVMRKKGYEVFAQGIVGTGVTVLYVSVYASFNFYHLIPQVLAFVLMSIATAIGLWQAISYRAIVIAILSWLGGYLTPFMLSTGEANPIGLFTYIALLTVGILAILYTLDEWISLELPTRAATYGIFALWFYKDYNENNNFAISLFFVTLFWFIFYGYEFLRLKSDKKVGHLVHQAGSTMNAITYYSFLYTILESRYPDYTAPIVLLYGFAYVVLYKIATRYNDTTKQILRERYAFAAAVTLFLATKIAFQDFIAVSCWSIEAFFILLLAKKINVKVLEWFGFGIYIIAAFVLLDARGAFNYTPLADYFPIINDRFLAYIILSVSMLISLLYDFRTKLFSLDVFGIILKISCVAFFLLGFMTEVDTVFDFQVLKSANTVSNQLPGDFELIGNLLTALTGLLTLTIGTVVSKRYSVKETLYTSAILFIPVVIYLLATAGVYSPIRTHTLFFNWRTSVFVTSIVLLYVSLKSIRKIKALTGSSALILQSIFTLLLFAIVLMLPFGEVYSFYEKLVLQSNDLYNYGSNLYYKRDLILVISWTLSVMCFLLLSRKYKNYVGYYTSSLFLAILFLVTLSLFWRYKPIGDFTICFNLRALTFVTEVVAFLFIAFSLKRYVGKEGDKLDIQIMRSFYAFTGILIFILLNIETIDYYEMLKYPLWDNVNIFADKEILIQHLTNKQQLAISIVWICYAGALLWVGIVKRKFVVRVIAMLLVMASILKVFLFDLSYLQTLYRIFSFIGLGFILMLLSYLYYRFKGVLLEETRLKSMEMNGENTTIPADGHQ